VIATTSVTVQPLPTILVNYITPPANEELPSSAVYSYANTVPVNFDDTGVLNPNASRPITAGNQQLGEIPRRILVWARQRDQDRTITSTDTFAQITAISVTWDNVNQLAGASPQQLFSISKDSGCDLTWQQWAGNSGTGSVLCLDLPTSIALQNPAEAPGLSTTKQLNMVVTIKNLNQVNPIWFSLYVCPIYDGLITIERNTMKTQNSILSVADVVDAKK
jgi:hypothetical protein